MVKIIINIRTYFLSLSVFLAVIAAVSGSAIAGASPERISIAYCKDCVPFHFSDENDQPTGIMIDFWRLWSEKTGIHNDFYFAVQEGNKALVKVLNQGMALITDEEKEEIHRRWMPSGDEGGISTSRTDEPLQVVLSEEELAWRQAHPIVRFGVTPDWPPFDIMTASGAYQGINADYISLLSRRLGLTIEPAYFKNWEKVVTNGREGKIDGVLAFPMTEERLKYFIFTSTYMNNPIAGLVPADATAIKAWSDLEGKTVILEAGNSLKDRLLKDFPGTQVIESETTADGVSMLAGGKGDIYLGWLGSISHVVQKYFYSNLRIAFTQIAEESKFRIGVHKSRPLLGSMLEKGILSITPEEHQTIHSKWIHVERDHHHAGQPPLFTLSEEEKAWIGKNPTIRVHNEMSWPPYNYYEGGKPQGYSIDFMKILAKRAGLKVEFVSGPTLDDFLKMTKNKEIDVMLNIAQNKEQGQYLEYTSPYLTLMQHIAYKTGDGPYYHISDLKEKKIAVVEGFFNISFLKEKHPDIKLVSFPDTLDALLAVSRGVADGFMGEFATINHFVSKHHITNLTLSPALERKEFQGTDLCIAVRNDWKTLAKILDKAIADISPKEHAELQQKWLVTQEESLPSEEDGQSTWWLLIGAITIFLIMMIGSLILLRLFSDEMLTRHFGSVRFRNITLTGMSLMVLMVGLLVWYTLDQNKKVALADIGEDMKAVLQNTMLSNDLWVHDQLNMLNQLGRDPELVAITKRLLEVQPEADVLKKSQPLAEAREFFAKREKEFGKIGFFIINPENISIGSRRDSNLGTKNLIAIQKPDLLAQVFQGASMFIPPIRSDVYIQVDDSMKEGSAEKPLTMFFAVPIQDLDEGVIAVLAQRLMPSGQMSQNMVIGRIGRSGETYMMNAEGQQVTQSRFHDQLYDIGLLDLEGPSSATITMRDPGVNLLKGKQSPTPRSEQPLTRMAEDLLHQARAMKEAVLPEEHSKITLNVNGYRDYRGVPVFGAWMWEPHLNLGRIFEIDVDEALRGYFTLRQNLLIITGVTLLLAIIATLLTIMLGERATRVMRRTQMELEERVAERTTDLTREVEDRKKSQKLTKRYEFIVNSVKDMMTFIGSDYTYRAVNDIWCENLGINRQDIIGKSVAEAWGAEPFEKEIKPHLDHCFAGEEVKYKIWFELRSGEKRHFDMRFYPYKTEELENSAVVVSHDITEQTRAEEKLKKLTRAVESNPMSVIITDRHGIIEYVNPKFSEISGYELDEAIGRNPRIMNSGHHPQEFYKDLWGTILAGKEWHGEFLNKRKTGELQWQSANIAPIFGENEKITHFVSIQEDITEKKRAAEELQKLSRAIEQSPVSVVITDPEGIIEYVNPEFCNLTGYSQEEAIGQNPRILSSGEHSPDFFKDMWETLLSGRTWTGELANKMKNGEIYWESANISPVLDTQGEITHYVAVKEDITQSKLLKEELIKAKEEAENANEAKSVFLASMSHELRTPMNSILGFSQLLDSDVNEPLSTEQKNHLKKIIRSGKHLLQLINEVLDLSRIESGELDLSFEPVNLCSVVLESIELVTPLAKSHNIKIIPDEPDEDFYITADISRFQQVILNLLSNAIKYNNPEGQVRLSCEKIDSHIRLTIADTGPGIKRDKIERLFEPFDRLGAETSSIEGTGIGLTITKRIVELMNGKIDLESEIGKGTRFFVDFPLAETPAEEKMIFNGLAAEAGGQKLEGNYTLLYVEDNQYNRELLEAILARTPNLKLLTAEDAEKGIDIAINLKPELILMDLNLPGIDGFEALQQLKETEATKQIPVVALSGNAMPLDVKKALNAGFVEYLTKPINIDDLYKVIGSALRKG